MRCFLVVEMILVGVSVSSTALVPNDSRNRNLGQSHRRGLSRAVGAFIGLSTALLPTVANTVDATTTLWQLGNGGVQIDEPLRFGTNFLLTEPRLLGSGGGGAVFSMRQNREDRIMALKISWIRSAASVENECRILQELETYNVPNVERCFGTQPYPLDARRVMILLEPVVDSSAAVASVTQVSSEPGQAQAVRQIVRTMVQMLNARVVMTDVQPLIVPTTGQLLLIDLTEARKVSDPLSFLDVTLARSFCTEMLTLIPETYQALAAHVLLTELKAVDSLPDEFYQILRDQTIVSSEVVAFIDSIIDVD
jgi:hypothetical protein